MNVRVFRRAPVYVRRDAKTVLTNGRVLYDALLSRTGIQTYGESVEYRPPDEVFAPDSLASLQLLPGTLLHPTTNYGTSFDAGAYPVRGCSGSSVIEHADGIHTSGQIMVWDATWNAQIESQETAELSVGFNLEPDPTPGVAPDGTAYQIVQRKIIGDHFAGVPEGNAGTARVVMDAKGERATRELLASIAAQRMDARPMYFDLGSWPARERNETHDMATQAPNPTPEMALAAAFAKRMDSKGITLAQRIDAFVDIYGDSSDEDMKAAMRAVGGSAPPAADPLAAAPAAQDAEEEDPPVTPPVDPAAAPAAAPPADPAAVDPDEEEDPARADAKAKRFDAAVNVAAAKRADVLVTAALVLGEQQNVLERKDGKPPTASTTEIMRATIGRFDAKLLAQVDRFDAGPSRDVALAIHFDAVATATREAHDYGAELAARVREVRADSQAQGDSDLLALQKRLDAAVAVAATNVYGAQGTAQAAT